MDGWLTQTRLRLKALFQRARLERDLEDELNFHLTKQEGKNRADGMEGAEARYAARRRLGNTAILKETNRDMWTFRWLDNFWQDIRFAARTLRKNPGFTIVAVLMLALGIGANTAIFSILHSVVFQPLPYPQPDRLVRIFSTRATPENYPVNGEDYFDWQSQSRTFSAMCLLTGPQRFNASGAGEPETVAVSRTQANFFSVIGVQPEYGPGFSVGQDRPGNNRVAVLSYGFSRRHFGVPDAAIGKTVNLNFEPYAVVGVMPPGFNYPESIDLWTPLEMTVDRLGHRGGYSYRVLARLKPGIAIPQAQADMTTIAKSLDEQYPITNKDLGARIVSLKELVTGDVRPQLFILFGAVTLVLLVACTNVANLLIARATGRQREIALRATLGAGRSRLVAQLLTESVLLSFAGAALGLAGAWCAVQFVQTAHTLPIPHQNPIRLDAMVLIFTTGLTVFVGILFGLAPAFGATRLNLSHELKSSAGSVAGASGWRLALRDALVVGEIAASLALLVGAGLLLRSFAQMRVADIGIRSQHILTASVVLPNTKYKTVPQRREFYNRLQDRLEHVPGVANAAISEQIPLEGSHTLGAKLEADLAKPEHAWLQVDANFVSRGYFQVFGIPFISGRDFTPQEIDRAAEAGRKNGEYWKSGATSTAPQPQLSTFAIINSAMARTLWPSQDPVGRVFMSGVQPVTVVGVVGNVKYGGIREPTQSEAYFPLAQGVDNIWYPGEISVRTSGATNSVFGGIRAAVSETDSELSLFNVRTIEDVVSTDMQDTTLQTVLLGSFATFGLILSSVGIYGLLAYLVTQRTHEIGIRVALGAQQSDILQIVVGRGLKLAFAGIGIGLVASFGLTRFLSRELFGVTTTDPLTFAGVSIVFILVALAACHIPARRAARVDPLIALRYE
ncbi:MAG TPA: ABC transporter permease [Candidatus Acidoferrum sp.]|jgi:putative ABC transport system permease protein